MGDVSSPPWAMGGFAVGARIAGYRLEEQVGQGGMAVVFKAYDERLNRLVALKILAPALATDTAFRRRFMRESQAAAAVDDPNIIPVFEAGESGGVLFIAMRLVRGGDVRSLVLSSGCLSPTRAVWIVSAVASALDAAHSTGLVHRDVKPANMLLDVRPGRPDHVYLSDFGLSKAALGSSGLTGTGQFLGTVDYSAPEQIEGRQVDGRTDQYALGCSAFELLSGDPPFKRDHGLATMYAHLSEPPPPLTARRSGLARAVDDVFAKVLAKSSADRYGSCQEFADDLRSALGIAPYSTDDTASPSERRPTDAIRQDPDLRPPTAPVGGQAPVEPDLALPDTDAGGAAPQPLPALSVASGETVNREPALGQATTDTNPGSAAVTQPPASHAESSQSGLPPGLPRSRRRRRVLVAGLAAVVTAIAALIALVATLSTAPPSARTARYDFAPQRYGDGLVIFRTWIIGGPHGTSFTDKVIIMSGTNKPLVVPFDEPIPSPIAPNLSTLRITPAASKLLIAAHAVQWMLRVPGHGHIVVGYQVAVPAGRVARSRLVPWADHVGTLASRLNKVPPAVLTSLAMTPAKVRLGVGSTVTLRLSGLISGHRRAPEALLAMARWSSQNPAIAAVNSAGKVRAQAVGQALVIARLNSKTASAQVIVTATASSPAGGPSSSIYTPPPSSSAHTSPPPSSAPTITPTSTLAEPAVAPAQVPSPMAEPTALPPAPARSVPESGWLMGMPPPWHLGAPKRLARPHAAEKAARTSWSLGYAV